MSEKENEKTKEITVYVKDLSGKKVELKLKPDSTFENLLIAFRKSEGTGVMNSSLYFELYFKGKFLSKELKDQDLKQIKINDLGIENNSTLMFFGHLELEENKLFSWADIKSVDEKDLTDEWRKKPSSTRITFIDLIDVNRVVGQKVIISWDKPSDEKHKQVNININNLKTENILKEKKEKEATDESGILLDNTKEMLKSNIISEKLKPNGIQEENLILKVKRSVKSFFLRVFEAIFGKSKPPIKTEINSDISGSFPENDLISNQEINTVPRALVSVKNTVRK